MKIKLTPALQALLQEVARGDASQELREAASLGAADGAVEWDVAKAAAAAARQRRGPGNVPSLEELCRGGGIAFPERPKGPGKPPELQKRLDELRARLEQQQYDRMVADVTQNERKAAAAREGGLSSYRQQMSFGVHVLAMMGAFYAFGHVAGMALTPNRAVHPFVGLLFMVFALVLESVLFIIRSTVPPKLHQAAARRATAARVAAQQQRQQQQAAAADGGEQAQAQLQQETPAGAAAASGSGAPPGQAAAAAAAVPKPAAEKKED